MPIVMLMVVLTFIVLAMANWKRSIGAGPTILIVGSIFLIGFIGIQYSTYQSDLRIYDKCVDQVDRSLALFTYNQKVVDVIDQDIEGRPELTANLRAAILPPLAESSCGEEPTYPLNF